MSEIAIERHPLTPFLPPNAHVLMLGSFPPPHARWCMEFYYPNFQNDMWRIMGLLFYGDKLHFVDAKTKSFRYAEVVNFCQQKGIAIFDTAQAIRRLRGNASDNFLEVVQPTDIAALLSQMPHCKALCATGQKAADTLAEWLECPTPAVGCYTDVRVGETNISFFRMPSSSRAYPLAIEKKAAAYQAMFQHLEMI